MNCNDVRPLHAAIKAVLRQARSLHAKRAASSVALLALSASGWVPTASAATYTATTQTEINNAVTAANASPDTSATIILLNDVIVDPATALPATSKAITINTQGFTIAGIDAAGGANGGRFAVTFVASNVTLVGNFRGGNAQLGAGGASAYARFGAVVTNMGTLQGGNSVGGDGGIGFESANPGGGASILNHGTIRGGSGLTNGTGGGGAAGAGIALRAGTSPVLNTGTIEGGNNAYAILVTGNTATTITNSGTIRAGAGRPDAIFASGATARFNLELQAGSQIVGNVVANAVLTTDVLRLGGAADSTFDVSTIGPQYQNFDRFEKAGTSTWTLTGTGTVATPWQIQQGTLQLGDGGTSGSIIGNVTNDGVLAFNRSDTSTFSGVISGSGAIEQRGTGTTVLTGTNTYAGGTTLKSGELSVAGEANLGSAAGALNFDGGVLRVTGTSFTSTPRSINWGAGGGSFNIADPANVFTVGQVLASGGGLTKLGAGTLVLTGANGYSGGTAINAGVLQISGDANLGDAAGDLNFNGGTLQTAADINSARAVSLLGAGTLVTDAGTTLTLNGVVSGAGSLAKGGAGTLVLAGANSYTGGTSINAGVLQVGNGGTTGSLTGDVTNNGTLVVDRSDAWTLAGAITGSGGLSQIGAGTTTLTGSNIFSGGTIISAGALQLGDGGTSGSLTGDVTNNGTLVFNRADALAFTGAVTGNGVLRQSGAGTTTLSAAGSNASTLDVQAGTLQLTSTASLSATAMSVAAGATLRIDGMLTGTAANNTFALAGTFIGSASLLDGDDQVQIADGANFSQAAFDGGAGLDTLDLTSGSAFTLPPAFATGFESLVKRGSGALTLSGTVDGFSDRITIAAGAMHLDGASIQTNEVRIDAGVTVTGTGSLSGSLNNAGLLSPGNSPGTIHVAGNYVQQASGTLVSEITRTGTDLLDIAGSATLAGTRQVQVEYGLYLDGTTHTLIQAAGGITGDFASEQMNPSALMEATRELSANALTVSFERQSFTSLTDLSDGRARFATYLEEQLAAGNVDTAMTDYIDTLLQQATDAQVANLLGERAEPVASVTQNNISILGAGFASTVFERFTLSDTAQCSPTQQGSNDTLNCFWAHGLRQWGNASGDARYDWTTDGGQIGVDRTLSANFALGATFGYADTGISDLNGGHNDLRSRMGGLYANYASGRLTLGALTFYSGNESETQRSVLVGSARQQARAEFDGDSYGASIRLGYRLTSDAGPLVRPYIEAFYDHVEATQFAEAGAGAGNLSARVHGRDGLRGTLGLQLADDFVGYGKVFRPALEVGVAHHFEDVRSAIDLQPFSDAPAFRAYGPALDRTSYIARASLNVSLGSNASVVLGYGGELSDDYSQHEGNLSFRLAW